MTAEALDLDVIGREITEPDLAVAGSVRQWLVEQGRDVELGRVADLADWWAGVRGHAQAPAPTRIAEALDELPETLDVAAAMAWGVARADALADDGTELIMLAVPDSEGTGFAAHLAAAELLGLDAVEATGWPLEQGLHDEDWMDAVVTLRDGLFRTRGLRGDLTALLTAAGSPVLAAATAMLVQSCVRHTPVLLDGDGALAAALIARRTSYGASQWWQVAHAADGVLTERMLASLHLTPLLALGLRVQDGTGARLALPLLTEAAGLLQ